MSTKADQGVQSVFFLFFFSSGERVRTVYKLAGVCVGVDDTIFKLSLFISLLYSGGAKQGGIFNRVKVYF